MMVTDLRLRAKRLRVSNFASGGSVADSAGHGRISCPSHGGIRRCQRTASDCSAGSTRRPQLDQVQRPRRLHVGVDNGQHRGGQLVEICIVRHRYDAGRNAAVILSGGMSRVNHSCRIPLPRRKMLLKPQRFGSPTAIAISGIPPGSESAVSEAAQTGWFAMMPRHCCTLRGNVRRFARPRPGQRITGPVAYLIKLHAEFAQITQ